MMRLLPHLLLPTFLCLLTTALRAQCGYHVALTTNKDYCIGSALKVSSSHTLETIVWYKDGQPVDTVKADESAFFPAGLAAGGNGDGAALDQCRPGALFVDEADNLYVVDNGRARIEKWRPGSATCQVVAGNHGYGDSAYQIRDAWDIFVDKQANIYVNDYMNSRVMKWAPGADSGITIVQFPKDERNQAMYVDCGGNVYIANQGAYPGLNITLYKVPAGSSTPTAVFSNNGDTKDFGSINNLFIDPAGNIVFNDYWNFRVTKWMPATGQFTVVAGAGGTATEAFHDAYLAAAVLAGIGTILAWTLIDTGLARSTMTRPTTEP